MRTLPTRWLSVYRLVAVAVGFAALTFGSAVAQSVSYQGTLSVIWGDPRPGFPGGETRFNLTLPNGTTYRLQIDPAQQNAAVLYFGKRVTVQGRLTPSPTGPAGIAVDRIEPLEPAQQTQPPLVTRKVLYLLVKYQGDSQEPHSKNFYLNLNNPQTPPNGSGVVATINGFFNKTSWGKLQWSGQIGGKGGLGAPSGWFTLPHSKSFYANCGFDKSCADIDKIATDAMNLAVAAGIDVTVFNNINIVLNNDLDCCAWGGGFSYGGKFYSATWEPPWGQEAGVYVHEMGHSIGLPHSGWKYYAYDSNWDQMSAGTAAVSAQCGTYNSANSGGSSRGLFCTEPGSGYIAPHKAVLGWLPESYIRTINAKTAASGLNVTLESDALPLAGKFKMIRVCIPGLACSGSTAHYLTVETRLRVAKFDMGLPNEGVLISDFKANRAPISGPCFFNNQSGWVVPIDRTPGDYNSATCDPGGRTYPNYGLHNAQFGVGQKYPNSIYGITIQVVQKIGSTFLVNVKRTK